MKKWQRGLIVFFVGGLLLWAAFGALMSTNIGSSLWQFDYAITEMTLNGRAQGESSYPSGESYTPPGGDIVITPDVRGLFDVRNSYEWWVDVDGQPIYTGTEWHGLLPDVGMQMSAPWRTDSGGNKIDYNTESVVVREWGGGEEVHREYLFYYAFDVMMLTKQDAFTVPGTAQSLGQTWISHECGVMDVHSLITVQMRKGMFGEVSGEFMDAKILDVEASELQLQSGLDWVCAPSVAVMQDRNARVPVQNREYGEDYYNCQIELFCTLTPGLSKELLGFDVNKYEVWCRKTVQFEMLLTQHLQIGEMGEPIDPLDPPWFQGFDWAGYIMIILLFVVAIIILVVVIYGLKTYAIIGGRR